jgi:glycosyltransferase involved in cell wall biosynthesis
VAASGIGAEAGKHLLIADEPGAFAEAVVRLLGDPVLRENLGRAGRELVKSRFSWKMKAEETDGLYREVLERIYG